MYRFAVTGPLEGGGGAFREHTDRVERYGVQEEPHEVRACVCACPPPHDPAKLYTADRSLTVDGAHTGRQC